MRIFCKTLGALNLVSYAKVRNKVVLVPVNGAILPGNVKQEIYAVFAQCVAEWDLVIAPDHRRSWRFPHHQPEL